MHRLSLAGLFLGILACGNGAAAPGGALPPSGLVPISGTHAAAPGLVAPSVAPVASVAATPSSQPAVLSAATLSGGSLALGGAAALVPAASAGPSASDEVLGVKVPERGFRLATQGRAIEPGSDIEYCEIAEIPGAPGELFAASRIEVANGMGSHHLIVEKAEPNSPVDRALRKLNVGDQVLCLGASQEFGVTGLTRLATIQTPHATNEFPSGVAQRLYGGQRVIFDYHYFNTSDKPLTAKSVMAVHTLASGQPVTFTNGMSFTNMTIDTPAMTEKTFTAAGHLKQDAMLMGLIRHTHSKGTDFSVWFDGGARDGELIWTSKDWEHETDFKFPAPIRVQAGEGFKFSCGFRNDSTSPLRFGTSAKDEMCLLVADIWNPTQQQDIAAEDYVITWIDAQGIGRDADHAGAFSQPAAAEVLSCTADTLGFGLLSSCVGCICQACATPWSRCMADADCKVLLECRSGCMGGGGTPECAQKCEPEMFKHSSAVGMVTQVGECIRAGCDATCAAESASGAAGASGGAAIPSP